MQIRDADTAILVRISTGDLQKAPTRLSFMAEVVYKSAPTEKIGVLFSTFIGSLYWF